LASSQDDDDDDDDDGDDDDDDGDDNDDDDDDVWLDLPNIIAKLTLYYNLIASIILIKSFYFLQQ
jgi:hypothetical protein